MDALVIVSMLVFVLFPVWGGVVALLKRNWVTQIAFWTYLTEWVIFLGISAISVSYNRDLVHSAVGLWSPVGIIAILVTAASLVVTYFRNRDYSSSDSEWVFMEAGMWFVIILVGLGLGYVAFNLVVGAINMIPPPPKAPLG